MVSNERNLTGLIVLWSFDAAKNGRVDLVYKKAFPGAQIGSLINELGNDGAVYGEALPQDLSQRSANSQNITSFSDFITGAEALKKVSRSKTMGSVSNTVVCVASSAENVRVALKAGYYCVHPHAPELKPHLDDARFRLSLDRHYNLWKATSVAETDATIRTIFKLDQSI